MEQQLLLIFRKAGPIHLLIIHYDYSQNIIDHMAGLELKWSIKHFDQNSGYGKFDQNR